MDIMYVLLVVSAVLFTAAFCSLIYYIAAWDRNRK